MNTAITGDGCNVIKPGTILKMTQGTVPLDSDSKDVYAKNSQTFDADIAKYAGSSVTRVEIVNTSSKVVNRDTRTADFIEERCADAIMAAMLTLALGPVDVLDMAYKVYGYITGAVEAAGSVIDLCCGTNNSDGTYQTYTVFVDTQETIHGTQTTKTTVIRYLWYKHDAATSWTLEYISTDYYYTGR